MSAQPPNRPPTPPPPPPSGGYGSGGYGSGGSGSGGDPDYSYSDPVPPGGGINKWLIAVAAIVALVIIGSLGYWFGGRDSGDNGAVATPTPSVSLSSAPPSAASAPPSTPSDAPSDAASSAPSEVPSATAAKPTTTKALTPTPTPTPTTTSPSPTPSPTGSPTPGVPTADFGYVTGMVTVGPLTYITFDRATLYTGAAAESAAKAHGQQVEDDYFIVNDNKLIRRQPLAPDVVVTGSSNLSGDVGPKPSSAAALKTWLDSHPGQTLPVNLYYNATGKVAKIAEVFFP